MLPEEPKNGLDQAAKKYFVDELGLSAETVSDAGANLTGAFEVLLRIDARLKRAQTTQPV